MSDRIDDLAKRAVDPRIDGWERGQAVAELATIAREAERDVATLKEAYDEKCHAYTLLREATLSVEVEADKWRKVAEAVGWIWLRDFYSAGTIDDDSEWAEEMVSTRLAAAVEQEEAE